MWDWQFVADIVPQLARGLVITIQATFLASILALILGLIMAIARRSPVPAVRMPVASLIEFIRRTPLLVQLYFLFFVLPDFGITMPALVTGVIGLGLHYSTYTSEIYRAGIEGVPRGQWEGAKALNYPSRYVWTRVVLPQAVPPMIPALGNYVLAMYKESALLSAITVVELMNSAQIIANSTYRYFEPMTMVGAFFLAVSLPAAFGVKRLEMWLVRR